ncbi:hypothetical protein DDV96_13080 [Marixanthomonas spongiae]|uniref:Uncharacterized protein n=2 Tax=Marixanthomonas spongiae TaxID=2174845 RepID=A0A2U0HXM7_9FLAO|nr:hypothetical protein DDV96_13080 [Marixanthomonas spongiae]
MSCEDKQNKNGIDKQAKKQITQTDKTNATKTNKTTYIKNNMKRLATLTPLTDKDYASWRPQKILGLPATNINTNSPDNVSMFDITYYANKQKVKLSIVDGAGKRGSQLTGPAHNIAYQNLNEEIPGGYFKTITQNGITAKEHYKKQDEEYRLSFLYHNRLYVTILTNNLGRKKTWQAIDAFNFKALLTKAGN